MKHFDTRTFLSYTWKVNYKTTDPSTLTRDHTHSTSGVIDSTTLHLKKVLVRLHIFRELPLGDALLKDFRHFFLRKDGPEVFQRRHFELVFVLLHVFLDESEVVAQPVGDLLM